MVEEIILIKDDDSIALKRAIAKSLYEEDFEQSTISKLLKISQPMVSLYINSKEKIPKNILKLSKKISNELKNNKQINFQYCISFSENKIEGKYYLANKNEIINSENQKIIDNLTEAFFIIKGKNISGLIPKVKINIAMAKSDAEHPEDVASYLNGLIIADDKIISNNGIHFGKSKHLSSLLLYLKDVFEINSIMNIAYFNEILKTDLNYCYLTKDYKIKDMKKNVDILLHKGDFGIEPCAYIIGKNAVDVVNKLIKIKEKMK